MKKRIAVYLGAFLIIAFSVVTYSSGRHYTNNRPSYHKLMSDRNADINFYGKITDQSGLPLEGVTVKVFIVGYEESLIKRTSTNDDQVRKNLEAISDYYGEFTIKGGRGRSLYVKEIVANDYFFDWSWIPNFTYGKGSGDPFFSDENNPIEFKLWPKSMARSLIRIEDSFRIPTTPPASPIPELVRKGIPLAISINATFNRNKITSVNYTMEAKGFKIVELSPRSNVIIKSDLGDTITKTPTQQTSPMQRIRIGVIMENGLSSILDISMNISSDRTSVWLDGFIDPEGKLILLDKSMLK